MKGNAYLNLCIKNGLYCILLDMWSLKVNAILFRKKHLSINTLTYFKFKCLVKYIVKLNNLVACCLLLVMK